MSTEREPPATILINLSEPLKESVDPTLYVRGDLFDALREALREIAKRKDCLCALNPNLKPCTELGTYCTWCIANRALVDIDEKD